MKALYLTFTLLLLLTAFSGVPAEAEVIDRIVAIVNDDIITLKDVQGYVEIKAKGRFLSVNDYFLGLQLKDKLEVMVETMLITQQAAKMKIEVGDREVEAFVDNIRRQNLVTDAQFREQLKGEGVSYKDFTEGIRKSILKNRVLARVVAPDLYLDDAKLKGFYQQHIDQFKQSEFRLKHILVSGQGNESTIRAQQAYKLLQDGQPFDSVAREYSNDPSAAQGGDIGTVNQEELMPELRGALDLLLPGSFSHPIRSQYGYHIILLVEAKKTQALPFEEVKDKIRDRLIQVESERRYKEYLQKLRASSYVEVKV